MTPQVRSFPGRGPGSEIHAEHPTHPDGCFLRWLRRSSGVRHVAVVPTPGKCRNGAAANSPIRRGAVSRHMDRRTAGSGWEHRGSLSTTVNGILALAATHVDTAGAQSALSYVEANANAYITADGADGPAQLAALILDAHALGVDPTNFGGTNLVARLLATEQTSGPDAGLFGTEQQLTDFFAGTYMQGLVFTALKAVGQTADAAADQLADRPAVPERRLDLARPGCRRWLHGKPSGLHRTRQPKHLARPPGAQGPRRARRRASKRRASPTSPPARTPMGGGARTRTRPRCRSRPIRSPPDS